MEKESIYFILYVVVLSAIITIIGMLIPWILRKIFKSKYSLNLPKRWGNTHCYECSRELVRGYNFDGWEIFVEIDGQPWSVGVCDECFKKKEIIQK